jgi:hypothetical protein
MRNSIYQSLSNSDKEKIQDNIKEYPCSGGILYNELNNNYYVTKINVGTLLDLSCILKINDLGKIITYLFDATQVNKWSDGHVCIPKQETLEEVAKQFEYTNGIYGFKEGVKWQAKRMYSEEEVIADVVKWLKEKIAK